jgi:hypothetical protein
MSDNGTWTLFLADLADGGGTSTLNSWGLNVTVPDQMQTGWVLGIGGFLILLLEGLIRSRSRTLQTFKSI